MKTIDSTLAHTPGLSTFHALISSTLPRLLGVILIYRDDDRDEHGDDGSRQRLIRRDFVPFPDLLLRWNRSICHVFQEVLGRGRGERNRAAESSAGRECVVRLVGGEQGSCVATSQEDVAHLHLLPVDDE